MRVKRRIFAFCHHKQFYRSTAIHPTARLQVDPAQDDSGCFGTSESSKGVPLKICRRLTCRRLGYWSRRRLHSLRLSALIERGSLRRIIAILPLQTGRQIDKSDSFKARVGEHGNSIRFNPDYLGIGVATTIKCLDGDRGSERSGTYGEKDEQDTFHATTFIDLWHGSKPYRRSRHGVAAVLAKSGIGALGK